MAKYRAQILLEPEQHDMLLEIARNQNESISHVVREIVGEYLSGVVEQEQRVRETRAVQTLKRLRGKIQQRSGVIELDLGGTREERSRDIFNRMGGNG